jgi:uncharacterized protein YicC (UPF0701 family)
MQDRLSVSLNEQSIAILEILATKYNTSHADIIRRSLHFMHIMENAMEKATLDDILAYVDYLADRDHVIVDIAAWKALCIELGKGSSKFWERIYKVGESNRRIYSDKGLKDIKQILKLIEKKNWFTVKEDSKNSFSLILNISETSQFIKTFLEGCFAEYPQKVEITEEDMKLHLHVHQ